MKTAADCARFQQLVNQLLVRHRSALDVLSKYQESNARVNRAVAKAVTNCGCLTVCARRQPIPNDISLEEMRNYTQTHLKGELCESCRQIIEMELGNNLFYLVSLCNLLGLDLNTVIDKESKKVMALGKFNLS